jgi:uncharacterized protein YodC (DUF2158 family)
VAPLVCRRINHLPWRRRDLKCVRNCDVHKCIGTASVYIRNDINGTYRCKWAVGTNGTYRCKWAVGTNGTHWTARDYGMHRANGTYRCKWAVGTNGTYRC